LARSLDLPELSAITFGADSLAPVVWRGNEVERDNEPFRAPMRSVVELVHIGCAFSHIVAVGRRPAS